MRFKSKDVPDLHIQNDEINVRFKGGFFETDDAKVIKALKNVALVNYVEVVEPPELTPPKPKAAPKSRKAVLNGKNHTK